MGRNWLPHTLADTVYLLVAVSIVVAAAVLVVAGAH